jgi:hypothetical protein
MVRTGCIAAPRGRCMTDIDPVAVLDAADRALHERAQRRAAPADTPVAPAAAER